MTLYDPQRHEALTDAAWDEARVRAAITHIAEDARAAFSEDGLWPIHPIDVSPERAATLTPLYHGAAGVIWSLRALHDGGAIELGGDYTRTVATLLERQRADSLRLAHAPNLAYPIGEAGVLLLHHALAPSADVEERLFVAIEANTDHPALGFLWGGAGSMLAAHIMFERTRDARWSALYLRLFERLWQRWEYDADLDCHLWTMDLYGARAKHAGGLHGWPGIVACMLRGQEHSSAARRSELVARARAALHATAQRRDGLANWALLAAAPGDFGATAVHVQHCVGAPGVVNCLASLPREPETDALLLAAGELTWLAGPVTKLPSLCHGVCGSGYAFLKLFARTGDERWLTRARRFALHGIEQAERGVQRHGQRKFSLWTGDLGLAIFLLDCIRARGLVPLLDIF